MDPNNDESINGAQINGLAPSKREKLWAKLKKLAISNVESDGSINGFQINSLTTRARRKLWAKLRNIAVTVLPGKSHPAAQPPARNIDVEEPEFAKNLTQLGVKLKFEEQEYVIAIDKTKPRYTPTIVKLQMQADYEVSNFAVDVSYKIEMKQVIEYNVLNFKVNAA